MNRKSTKRSTREESAPFSRKWFDKYEECIDSKRTRNIRKKYNISRPLSPQQMISVEDAEGVYEFLLDEGLGIGPALNILNMDKTLTMGGLRKMRYILCRWPRPHDIRMLQAVVLKRIPETRSELLQSSGGPGNIMLVRALDVLMEQAMNSAYFEGMFEVIFRAHGNGDTASSREVVSMLVGKQGTYFSKITHKFRLMYVWIDEITSNERYRIYCYGRDRSNVSSAMTYIQNKMEQLSISKSFKVTDHVINRLLFS